MPSRGFDELFDKLASAEEQFLHSEFLAPVVAGGDVRVRIAGVVCRLSISPRSCTGWGVFRPTSHSAAQHVRDASLSERRRYLELFPVVRLILCLRNKNTWCALSAHRGDSRFQIAGLVPVQLVEDGRQFEIIRTRFDGTNFWYEEPDPGRSPATAAYLREQLNQETEPNQLDRSGLTPEEKAAYAANLILKDEPETGAGASTPESRLRLALEHAGAEFVEYLERGDSYQVTYTIGGRRHVSAVNKNDLTVQVAGICLAGQDRRFDLASLVGVIREGETGGEIVAVGDENAGMDEEAYWNVHPPNA